MPNKLVLKTHISCTKCKSTILVAITKHEGIDEVSIDAEKGTVTVIGDVDPTKVVKSLRKAGKHVIIESLGPHKKEQPKKKEEEKEKPNNIPALVMLPHCCDGCENGGKHLVIIEESQPSCNIL